VYLIFAEQVFFGVLSIILAFLIFPNRSNINSKSHHYNYDNNYSSDHAYSADSDSSGGDSGGSGGND
jgi:hypothetical protein